MAFPAVAHFTLPQPPYDLWLSGALLGALGIRDDAGSRVEVVGGEIVVSTAPQAGHTDVVTQIRDAFTAAGQADADFPWLCAQDVGVNLKRIADGYIPDLIVLAHGEADAASAAGAGNLLPPQIGLVVEVASQANADDRRLGDRRRRPTKWGGYASEGVGYCLQVDRDPRVAKSTLLFDPDPDEGAYQRCREWPFGESITLPEPFGVDIPTDTWQPWAR